MASRRCSPIDVLNGAVLGRCMMQHRHRESIRFLKAVERIRRGVFESVADLEHAIAADIREDNKTAKPFRWEKPQMRFSPNSPDCL